MKKASQLTCTVFSKCLKREIVMIVDNEKRVKHSKLAEDIEQAITDGTHLPPDLDLESVSQSQYLFNKLFSPISFVPSII